MSMWQNDDFLDPSLRALIKRGCMQDAVMSLSDGLWTTDKLPQMNQAEKQNIMIIEVKKHQQVKNNL